MFLASFPSGCMEGISALFALVWRAFLHNLPQIVSVTAIRIPSILPKFVKNKHLYYILYILYFNLFLKCNFFFFILT